MLSFLLATLNLPHSRIIYSLHIISYHFILFLHLICLYEEIAIAIDGRLRGPYIAIRPNAVTPAYEYIHQWGYCC